MNIFNPKLLTSAIITSLALGTATPALSQATDSATSMITLLFNEVIDIANVDAVTITDPILGTDAMGSDAFCVSGSGFSTFSITFANAGTDPAFFLLSSNGTPEIPYDVGFSNSVTGQGTIALAGVPLTGNTLNSSNCINDNARFDIFIPFSIWDGRQADGPFIGTLMITVESE
ncbi:hypothetical protein ACCI51_17575 [Microbulbifer echini]|uniref:Uncharacterized protein n=1 Tax=Microbulbifer echini TaxID=1529067 RepID=A0ABV4NSI2_9GAMM|nr:hypothetical protein [uncultured Microbulbifer sp.]